MIGLKNLEVYNSFFKIADENNKFEFYTEIFDHFSCEEPKAELEKIFSDSDVTPKQLHYDKIRPCIFKAYNKMRLEKSSTDGFIILLRGSARLPYQNFGTYLRLVVDLDEDDIQLILKQYSSHFITYVIPPGVYSNK